jgi:3'-phosphoadenosine 5'-phosphosulfate sulfotransferase (PAPS reductase)/FAD synthetase
MTAFDLSNAQTELLGKNPRTILKAALSSFDNIAISFSGAEDVVLIDMALQIRKDIQVFSLDTGRLHPETYRFIEKVRKHYQIEIEFLRRWPLGMLRHTQSRTVASQAGDVGCMDYRPTQRSKSGYAWRYTGSPTRQRIFRAG